MPGGIMTAQGSSVASNRVLDRVKGTGATTIASVLSVATGAPNKHIVSMLFANRHATTASWVRAAHRATGETAADDTYDVINEENILAADFLLFQAPHPEVPLIVLKPGDNLDLDAENASSINYEIVYWTERV